MVTRIPKRLLVLLFVLMYLFSASIATGVTLAAHPAAAYSTHSLVDVEDTDAPAGWINHKIHLHPVSQVLSDPVTFNITGNGLPPGATLTFYSDFGGRCSSNTVDVLTVLVSGDGTFPPQDVTASSCKAGGYLIEAIDALGHVYPAFLTIRS